MICSSCNKNPEARNWIKTTIWPAMKVADEYVYLGILFGAQVSTTDVYRAAVEKLEARATLFGPVFALLSYPQRVLLFNVFLISMLVYISRFFIFPAGAGELEARIVRIIRTRIITYKGSAYKHFHLYQPHDRVGKLPAVRNIWALNVAMLAEQADLHVWDKITQLPTAANQENNSMIIADHIRQCAEDFVCSSLGGLYPHEDDRFLADQFVKNTRAKTRTAIYQRYIYCELHYTHQDPDIQDKLARRQLPPLPLPHDPAPVQWLHQHFHYLSSRIPNHYRNVQFDLLFNSLSTDRRYRHAAQVSKADVAACFFCGAGDDGIMHLFTGACAVVTQARSVYARTIQINLSPTSLNGADFHRSSFLAFHPTTPTATRAIALFNSQVWYERCNYFRVLDKVPKRKTAVQRLSSTAIADWLQLSQPQSKTTFGSAGKRSSRQLQAAQEYATDLISQTGPDDVVAYTDGASQGNPGPSGAGAYIEWPSSLARGADELSVALGPGTNNMAELWAIAMTLQLLMAVLPTFPFTGTVHLFSDSEYAIQAILKPYASTKASPIAAATRRLYLTCSNLVTIFLHWIPGHADIPGNERADATATHGAEQSKLGQAIKNIDSRIKTRQFLTYCALGGPGPPSMPPT